MEERGYKNSPIIFAILPLMPRRIYLLVFSLWFIVFSILAFRPAVAQTPTPTSVLQEQDPLKGVKEFLENILHPKIETYNKATLPIPNNPSATPNPESKVQGISIPDIFGIIAHDYSLSSSGKTPTQTNSDILQWLVDLKDTIVGEKGKQEAQNFANSILPNQMGNSLGVENAFDTARCAVLPPGAQGCVANAAIGDPNLPTVTPGGPTVTPYPPGTTIVPGQFVYYSQCDASWRYHPPPPEVMCNSEPMGIGNAGCNPTSTAMVLATILKDGNIIPSKVWDDFASVNGMKCTDSGGNLIGSHGGSSFTTTVEVLKKYLDKYNISVDYKIFPGNQELAKQTMKNYLDTGLYYIITAVSLYNGHVLVVDRISSDLNTVYVNDPNSKCSQGQVDTGESILPSGVNFLSGFITIKYR